MAFMRMRNAASHLLSHEHPFNEALYRGTLPRNIFRFYLEQDALYLSDFSRALMLVSRRFSNYEYAEEFKMLSTEILDTERNLHFKYLGEPRPIGLFSSKKTLEKIPAVSGYTQHLIQTAATSSIEEAVASFLPCFWIYTELGKKMSAIHANNPYRSWLLSYSSEQFTSATGSVIKIADELGNKISCPVKQKNMISAFVTSTEYEILFWDSVYRKSELSNALMEKPVKFAK